MRAFSMRRNVEASKKEKNIVGGMAERLAEAALYARADRQSMLVSGGS